MRIGSLFSGAGGLDMAVEHIFNGYTVWHCENDAAASKVLGYRWPGVPNLGDITRVDWSTAEPVDILAGGFPCQDVSAAGRLAGLRHGTRSGTFHHLIQAVTVLRPALVVLENTFGLMTADGDEWPDEVTALAAEVERWGRIKTLIDCKIRAERKRGQRDKAWWHRKQTEKIRASRRHRIALAEFRRQRLRLVPRAIGTVLWCLAACGYDAQWVCLPASDVGAPHRRERIFVIAQAKCPGRQRWQTTEPRSVGCGRASSQSDGYSPLTPDTASIRRHEGRPESAGIIGGSDAAVSGAGPVNLLPTPNSNDFKGADPKKVSWENATKSRGEGGASGLADVACLLLPTPTARDGKGANQRGDDTCLTGALLPTPEAKNAHAGPDYARMNREGSGGHDLVTALAYDNVAETRWGKYESAIRRWEMLTRPAPAPTEPNTKGNPRLSAAFSEWLMGWPDGWVTQVPGVSRNDALRIIGNGVVPQQAVAALSWLLWVSKEAA